MFFILSAMSASFVQGLCKGLAAGQGEKGDKGATGGMPAGASKLDAPAQKEGRSDTIIYAYILPRIRYMYVSIMVFGFLVLDVSVLGA